MGKEGGKGGIGESGGQKLLGRGREKGKEDKGRVREENEGEEKEKDDGC